MPYELYRRFFVLCVVNILSNLLVPLASLCDTAFLGHLAVIDHLAGVALASVLFNYIYWTFGFLRMGTTGMTAQATGRGEVETVVLIALRNILIALGIGLIILLLQQPLRELGFRVLSATLEVEISGRNYYDALIWSAPANLINFVLLGWFLGREQVSKVFLLSAINNGSNVILNYLFIVRFGWASTGAGMATAISQYFMLLLGLILLGQEISWQQWQAARNKIFIKAELQAVFRLNSDILMRTFVLISTFALFTNLSSFFGTLILAINTVLMQVVTLAAYFIDGVAFATESVAGNLRGEGRYQQLFNLVYLSGGVSLFLGLAFALIFIQFPDSLFGLLTNHTEVIAGIKEYLLWLLPVLLFGSVAYMLDGYFLGLTEGQILRISAIVASLFGFVPLAIVAWQLRSIHLLWLALSMFMLGRMLTLGMQVPKTVKVSE